MATYASYTDADGHVIPARVVTMRDGIAVMDNGHELVLCDVGWVDDRWDAAIEYLTGTDDVIRSLRGKSLRRAYAYMARR